MATRYCGSITIKIRPDYNKRPTRYVCRLSTSGTSIVVSAPANGYGPGVADDSPEAMDSAARAALSFADDFSTGSLVDGSEFGPRGWLVRRTKSASHDSKWQSIAMSALKSRALLSVLDDGGKPDGCVL